MLALCKRYGNPYIIHVQYNDDKPVAWLSEERREAGMAISSRNFSLNSTGRLFWTCRLLSMRVLLWNHNQLISMIFFLPDWQNHMLRIKPEF